MLATAVRRSRRWTGPKLRSALQRTRGFRGVTGETTVLPMSGNRADPPVVILDVSPAGRYVVDPAWASFAGYLYHPSTPVGRGTAGRASGAARAVQRAALRARSGTRAAPR